MLKNYYKTTLRGLVKNRLFSFVNIGGLSIGLALGIIFILFIKTELEYDRFHRNLPDIYIMMLNDKRENVVYTGRNTTPALAPALKEALPEINAIARVAQAGDQLINAGEKSTYEKGAYADPDLFRIMRFPAIAGDPVAALSDPGSIVISESIARKFFGKEDPIGKIIKHNNVRNLKVAAVIKDIPATSSFKFDVITPYRIIEQEQPGVSDRWDYNAMQTYLELKPHTDATAFNAKIKSLLEKRLNPSESGSAAVFAYPYADLHLYNKFKDGKPNGGRIQVIQFIIITGIFVLLLACVNFMNLATARSAHRAREVGVRKALGASRKQVITQFLLEATGMAFLALLLGILLAKLSLHTMNIFLHTTLAIDFTDWKMWSAITLLTLITGLVAGSYPAFFLSSFQPVRVLKGLVIKQRGGALLRKGFVTFQFMISIFLIISTIVIFKQQQYVMGLPLGYEQENLVDIPTHGDMAAKFNTIKEALQQVPGVKMVSGGSDNLVRFNGATDGITWPGKTPDQDFMVNISYVHYNWVKTAGLTLVEGRDFTPDYGADSASGCILNETAVKKMGLKPPVVGTKLGNNIVTGVVKDFSFNDPFEATAPLAVYLNTGNMGHIFVRLVNDQNWRGTMDKIEAAINKVAPGYPFEFHFTEDAQERKYEGIRSTWQMISVVGTLAIIISCLGLLGLSAFLAERRTKEIGIRKVFGASLTALWFMLSKEFLKPVILAFLLAAPLAGLAMHKLLLNMEYRIGLSWWMFAIAGLMAVLIAMFTVSYQGIKAALTNPVDSLRAE